MGIVWSNTLSVGHAGIDAEHRRLIEIINRLETAIDAGLGHDAVGDILCDLSEYCTHHFDLEEQEMLRCRYGGYRHHKGQHDQLIQQLSELVFRFESRGAGLTVDTLHFVTGWLTDHIVIEDRKLAAILTPIPITRAATA